MDLPLGKLKKSDKRDGAVLVATGSFNPPTSMHLRMFELGKDFLEEHGYDVLGGYMSPVNDKYGKKNLAQHEHRIKMCSAATRDSSFVMVDSWEAEQAEYQRTVFVLRRVQSKLKQNGIKARVFFLCGADLLASILIPNIWRLEEVEEICRDFGIICVCRTGQDVQKIISGSTILSKYKENISIIQNTLDVSSTSVREKISRGMCVKNLTSDLVIDYIKEHQLYLHS